MANNYNDKENRRNKQGSSLLTFIANAAALSTLFNKKLRTNILNLFMNNSFISPKTVAQNQAQQTQKTATKTSLTYNEIDYISQFEGLERVYQENLKSTESNKRYNEKVNLYTTYSEKLKELTSKHKNPDLYLSNFFINDYRFIKKSKINIDKFNKVQHDVRTFFSLDKIIAKYKKYINKELNLFNQIKKNQTFYKYNPKEISEKIKYINYIRNKIRMLNHYYLTYTTKYLRDPEFASSYEGIRISKILQEESQNLLKTFNPVKDVQEYVFNKDGHFNNLTQQEINKIQDSFSLINDFETRQALIKIQQNTKNQYIELFSDKDAFADKVKILKQQGIINKNVIIDDSYREILLNYFKNVNIEKFNSLQWQDIERKINNVKTTLENTGKNKVNIKLVKNNERVKVVFDIQVKLKDSVKSKLSQEEIKAIRCGKYQVEVYLPYKNTITPDYTKEGVVVDMSSFQTQLNTIINEAENNAKDLTLYDPKMSSEYKDKLLKQKANNIKNNFNQGLRKLGNTATSEYSRLFELTDRSFDISKDMLSGKTYKEEIHSLFKNVINPLFNDRSSEGKKLSNYNGKIINIDTEFDAANNKLKEITFIITDKNGNKKVQTFINKEYEPTVFDIISETDISAEKIKEQFHEGQVETCVNEEDLYNKINNFIKDKDNDIPNGKIVAKSPSIFKNGKETSDIGVLKAALNKDDGRFKNKFPEAEKLINGILYWQDTQKIADIIPNYTTVYHRSRSENIPRFLKDLYKLSRFDPILRQKMDTVIKKLDDAYASNRSISPLNSIIKQNSNAQNLHLSRSDTLLNDCLIEFVKILSEENHNGKIKYTEQAFWYRLSESPIPNANLFLNGYFSENSQFTAANKWAKIPINMVVPFGTTNIGVVDKLYQYRQTLKLVDPNGRTLRKERFLPSVYTKTLFNSKVRQLTDNYELAANVSLVFGAQTEQLFQEGGAVLNGNTDLNRIHFASDIEETIHVDKLDKSITKDFIIENNAKIGSNVTYDNKGNLFGSKEVLNITGNKLLVTQIIPNDKGGYDIRYRKVSTISANVKLNSLGSGMSVATFRDYLKGADQRTIDLSIGANTYFKKGSSVQMLNMMLGSVSQHLEENSNITINDVNTALKTSGLFKYVEAKEENKRILFIVDNDAISNDISIKYSKNNKQELPQAFEDVKSIVKKVQNFSKSIGLNEIVDKDIRNSVFFTPNAINNIVSKTKYKYYQKRKGEKLKKFYFREVTRAFTASLVNQNKLSEEGLYFLSYITGINRKSIESFKNVKDINKWNKWLKNILLDSYNKGNVLIKMLGLRYDGTQSQITPTLTFQSRMSFRVISNLATNIANANSFKIDKVFTTLLKMQPGGSEISKYFEDFIKKQKDTTYTYTLQKIIFDKGINALEDPKKVLKLEDILDTSLEKLGYKTDSEKEKFLKEEVLHAIETQENGTFAIKNGMYEPDTIVDLKLVKNEKDAYVKLQKEIHEQVRNGNNVIYYKHNGKVYTYFADQIMGSNIEGEEGKYLTTEFYRHLMKNVMNIKGIKKYTNEELENEFFNTILNKYTRNLVKAEVPSVAGTVDFGKPIINSGSIDDYFSYTRSLYYNEAIVSKNQFYKVKKKIEETSIEEINYAIKYMKNYGGQKHMRLKYIESASNLKKHYVYDESINRFTEFYNQINKNNKSTNAFLDFINNSSLSDVEKKQLYIKAVEEGLLPIFGVGVKYPVSQYDVVTGQATFFMDLSGEETTLKTVNGYSRNTTLLHPFLMKLAKIDKDTDTYMLALASGSGTAVEKYFEKYYSTDERYKIATDATLFKTDNNNFANKYFILEKSFYNGQALLVDPLNPRNTVLKKLTPTEIQLNNTFGISTRQRDMIQAMIKNFTIKTKAPDVYEVMASNLFMNEEVYKLSPEAQRYFQTKIGPIMELPLNVRNKFSKENVFTFLDYLRGHTNNAKEFIDNIKNKTHNENIEIGKYFDPLINENSSAEEIKYVNELINVINKREQNNPQFTPLTTKSIRAVDIMKYNLAQEEWKEIHKTIRNLPYRSLLDNPYERPEHVTSFINTLQTVTDKSINHFKSMSNKKKVLFSILGLGLGALILSEPDLGHIPGTGRQSMFSWSTDERQYEEMMNSPLNQGKVRLMRYNYNEKIRPSSQIERNLYTPLVNQL